MSAARHELRAQSEQFRRAFADLPAIVPLRTTTPPPPAVRSPFYAPEDPTCDVASIETFNGRVLLVTVERQSSGGHVLALRDFDRSVMQGSGPAERYVQIPLRCLADVADALCETIARASAVYGIDEGAR